VLATALANFFADICLLQAFATNAMKETYYGISNQDSKCTKGFKTPDPFVVKTF